MATMSKNDENNIKIAKEAYAIAQSKGDTAGMEAAHKTAENIRAKYGYSGGADGSQNIALSSSSSSSSGGSSSKSSSSSSSSKKTTTSTASSTGAMTDSDKNAIKIAQEAYAAAQAKGDTAGMEAAHNTAESIRAKYGYSGGADGSQYISLSTGAPQWIGDGPTANYTAANQLGKTTDYGTYEQDLKKLTKAQKQAQIDALKAARTKALANLDAQEQTIKPTYEAARNQTAASSQQGARNFAEYLANRGLSNSGAAAQGELSRLSALNNNLGNLNTAEANAYRDIANQRTQVENDYVSGLANANNAITANYYNNLLNYNENQRQYVQNLQAQALGQYSNDYQAQINNLLAQGYSPNSLEVLQLQALRGNKINSANTNAYTYQNALNNIANGNYSYNDLLYAGMTQEQATEYYNQVQKQKQAEAEQQQFENNLSYQNYLLNAQKVANDTAQTKYNINKPYYAPKTTVSNAGDSNNNTLKQSDVSSVLKGMTTTEKVQYLDNLYSSGAINDSTYMYFNNLYQLPIN